MGTTAYMATTEGFSTPIFTTVSDLQIALVSLRDDFGLYGKEVRIFVGKLFGECFERSAMPVKITRFCERASL